MSIYANLKHYYQTRGKGEIISFLTNLSTGFGIVFALLAYAHFEHLMNPEVEVEKIAILIALANAAFRSIVAGTIYAIIKNIVPQSIFDKFEQLFLRARK